MAAKNNHQFPNTYRRPQKNGDDHIQLLKVHPYFHDINL